MIETRVRVFMCVLLLSPSLIVHLNGPYYKSHKQIATLNVEYFVETIRRTNLLRNVGVSVVTTCERTPVRVSLPP